MLMLLALPLMLNGGEKVTHSDSNACFFLYFTHERGFGGFTELDMTAWQKRMFLLFAIGEEDFIIMNENATTEQFDVGRMFVHSEVKI